MIDYIPPDIPPAIVKYVESHYPNKPHGSMTHRWYMYLTSWNNYELYLTDWSRTELLATGFPTLLVYDCRDARRATREEVLETRALVRKYMGRYERQEHLCHRDKRAYNQHTKPEDYEKKVKHITPKYVPDAVSQYIDKRYNDSLYPGTTKRIIKYLTTYNNKEVYLFYWTEPFSKHRTAYRAVLYDCENVRIPSLPEWSEMRQKPSFFDVFSRPYLCKKR